MTFQAPQLDLTRYQFPLQAFIGGKFVDNTGNDKHTLVSSVNDDIITKELQWSNTEDVDLAVDAAEEGLREWKAMGRGQRRNALVRFGALIRENSEQLHWLEAMLVGKDAGFRNFEVGAAADLFICEIFCPYPSHYVWTVIEIQHIDIGTATDYGNMIDKFSIEVVHTEDNSMGSLRSLSDSYQ
ncbi:unnamed protein product [Clonostachys rosea]|uniref:Aldehyde dehydrogenase domain-containing protein n=1 Tax=Bionectria ochroleuca TaxID=29856 RepID=A0ABY6UA32_BIOOC|nr:unnamed protein product [Clonostachys rosea]